MNELTLTQSQLWNDFHSQPSCPHIFSQFAENQQPWIYFKQFKNSENFCKIGHFVLLSFSSSTTSVLQTAVGGRQWLHAYMSIWACPALWPLTPDLSRPSFVRPHTIWAWSAPQKRDLRPSIFSMITEVSHPFPLPHPPPYLRLPV